MLFGKGQRSAVPERLMGTNGIVPHQPFSEFLIENTYVGGVVSEVQKFFLQGSVEPFIPWIILGCSRTTPPMREPKLFQFSLEVFAKFAAVVGMDMDDVAFQQVVKTLEEVLGTRRSVGRIHPRVSDSRVLVHRRQNVAFLVVAAQDDAAEVEEEAGTGVLEQVGDPFLGLSLPSTRIPLLWSTLQPVGFDDPLDIPLRHRFAVCPCIQDPGLGLAVSGVVFPQRKNSIFLNFSAGGFKKGKAKACAGLPPSPRGGVWRESERTI
jgi:hypothetical protein